MKLQKVIQIASVLTGLCLMAASKPALAHDEYCNRDCRAHHIHVYADDPLIRNIVRDIQRFQDRICDLERRRDEEKRYRDWGAVHRTEDAIRDFKHDLDAAKRDLHRAIEDARRDRDRDRDRDRSRDYRYNSSRGERDRDLFSRNGRDDNYRRRN